jgi:FkbM family methyltransferase
MSDFRSLVTAFLRRCARVLPVESRFRQFLSHSWDRILHVTGRTISVPIAGHVVQFGNKFRHIDPEYEAETLRQWLAALRPGDVVWDVGANIGIYAVLSGRAVGLTGTVWSWEPAPDSFRTLQDHIRANRLDATCRPIHEAIGDRDGGVIEFTIVSEGENSTNRIASAGQMGSVVSVPVATLDGWLRRAERAPNAVKIDIEGAEVLALRGATDVFAPNGPRPLCLLAVHPMFLGEFGHRPEDVTAEVRRLGLRCYSLEGRETVPESYAEYWLVPPERAAEFEASFLTARSRASR